ncbi:hypothetical protein WICPIJ_006148 [Wickerhamomyces pijperi]|uniref:Uncharacterized protein n=1 Tax=Wickerhamomyces pijperi TaxID=599730 RepID=A0A9P8Q2D5_WICPI|nr:hypothetical protein WICPIJ_006148 [Wickerhamomyces pijperi]
MFLRTVKLAPLKESSANTALVLLPLLSPTIKSMSAPVEPSASLNKAEVKIVFIVRFLMLISTEVVW